MEPSAYSEEGLLPWCSCGCTIRWPCLQEMETATDTHCSFCPQTSDHRWSAAAARDSVVPSGPLRQLVQLQLQMPASLLSSWNTQTWYRRVQGCVGGDGHKLPVPLKHLNHPASNISVLTWSCLYLLSLLLVMRGVTRELQTVAILWHYLISIIISNICVKNPEYTYFLLSCLSSI